MLMPASRRYCTHPALWVPFEPQAAVRRAAAAKAAAAQAAAAQAAVDGTDAATTESAAAAAEGAGEEPPLVFTKHPPVAIVAVAGPAAALFCADGS